MSSEVIGSSPIVNLMFFNNSFQCSYNYLVVNYYKKNVNNVFKLNDFNIFYYTKYKMNFRYSISIISNKISILSYSLRNFFNKSFKSINKKLRYSTVNFFLLKLLSTLLNLYNFKLNLMFFNISFIGVSYLESLFKNIEKINLNYFMIIFNTNFSYKLDKYFKKIKTIKKFKRKIYLRLSKVNFKNIYFI